jgi:hypothetical protein
VVKYAERYFIGPLPVCFGLLKSRSFAPKNAPAHDIAPDWPGAPTILFVKSGRVPAREQAFLRALERGLKYIERSKGAMACSMVVRP